MNKILIVWWGERNGRMVTSASLRLNLPATEWILVVSSASSMLNGGSMDGSRFASMVLPDPGGPMRITL